MPADDRKSKSGSKKSYVAESEDMTIGAKEELQPEQFIADGLIDDTLMEDICGAPHLSKTDKTFLVSAFLGRLDLLKESMEGPDFNIGAANEYSESALDMVQKGKDKLKENGNYTEQDIENYDKCEKFLVENGAKTGASMIGGRGMSTTTLLYLCLLAGCVVAYLIYTNYMQTPKSPYRDEKMEL